MNYVHHMYSTVLQNFFGSFPRFCTPGLSMCFFSMMSLGSSSASQAFLRHGGMDEGGLASGQGRGRRDGPVLDRGQLVGSGRRVWAAIGWQYGSEVVRSGENRQLSSGLLGVSSFSFIFHPCSPGFLDLERG